MQTECEHQLLSGFPKHEFLSTAGVMCMDKTIEANACRLIGHICISHSPSRSLERRFYSDSMQIRPLLTAFQFAHNLTSCHFFLEHISLSLWKNMCVSCVVPSKLSNKSNRAFQTINCSFVFIATDFFPSVYQLPTVIRTTDFLRRKRNWFEH